MRTAAQAAGPFNSAYVATHRAMQRRPARTLRVVFMRDRCAEQRHDAVAGVLVDGAFEAMHAVGENLEEAIEMRATPASMIARSVPCGRPCFGTIVSHVLPLSGYTSRVAALAPLGA